MQSAPETPNPYAPPTSQVDHITPARTVRPGFPWLLALRWLIGIATVISGVLGLYNLAASWHDMAERAIIDPYYSPYRYLPAALLKLATGIAVLLRSKWSIPLALGWIIAFAYIFLGGVQWKDLPPVFFMSLMEIFAIFAFLCLLGLRGRLR